MKEKKDNAVLEQLIAVDTGCSFRLENFEGPLDLLLHLIKDAKLEISEVKLADITDQYLEYMAGLDELDLEKASDFIDLAATLIEIKSKSLLPRMEEEVAEEDDSEANIMSAREFGLHAIHFKSYEQGRKELEELLAE